MNRKTFDKQQFAKMLFNLLANYQTNYHWDAFYDIPKMLNLIDTQYAGKNMYNYFVLYIRESGFDFVRFEDSEISTESPSLTDTRFRNNDIVLHCDVFTNDNANDEEITVTIKKNHKNFDIF